MFKQISVFFAAALLLSACDDTNENLVGHRGEGVVPVISDVNPAFYTSDLANSFIAFSVDLQEGDEVDAAELEVSFGGVSAMVRSISSFPATISLTATEAMAALGLSTDDVEIGDSFLVYVLTTKDGVTTRSQAALNVLVTCEFDPDVLGGSYKMVSEDWEISGDVTVTVDASNPYQISITGITDVEGLVGNGNALILTIDQNSFKMTGAKTILAADLAPWDLSYTNYYYEPIGGLYSSCDGAFSMTFKIGVDQGSFGNYGFTFTPNE